MNSDIKYNLSQVKSRIEAYAIKHHRTPSDIDLLAVSKTFPAQQIKLAWEAGQSAFGESYIDEALVKINSLSDLDIQWHFIGPVQSNKTRKIAENFDWLHSLSSIKHARRLNDQRPDDIPPLNTCIQVNISGEESKSGLRPAEVMAFAENLQAFSAIRLRGVMGIPARTTDFTKQRAAFSSLASIHETLKTTYDSIDTLSMGMSADMEAAIAEGSTMVRIGTAIFGERGQTTG